MNWLTGITPKYGDKIMNGDKEYKVTEVSNDNPVNDGVNFALVVLTVSSFFNDDIKKTVAWLTTKNPQLGNSSPLKLIKEGRSRKVLQFVEVQRDERYEILRKKDK